MNFISELVSLFPRSKRKAADGESPAKRLRQEQAAAEQQGATRDKQQAQRDGAPASSAQALASAGGATAPLPQQTLLQQWPQAGEQQQQQRRRQRPQGIHHPQPAQSPGLGPGPGRRRPMNNAFQQLGAAGSPSPLAQPGGGGAASAERSKSMRFFSRAVALQPPAGTPLVGWAWGGATPGGGTQLHSHLRPGLDAGAAATTRTAALRAAEGATAAPSAAAAAAAAAAATSVTAAAAAVTAARRGAAPAAVPDRTPDVKQRLCFDATPLAVAGRECASGAGAGSEAGLDAGRAGGSMAAGGTPLGVSPGLAFAAAMARAAPTLGVGLAASTPGGPSAPAAAALLASPPLGAHRAAAAAAAPVAGGQEARLQQEIADKSALLDKLTRRNQDYAAHTLGPLLSRSSALLSLSPEYQVNPASFAVVLQLEARGASEVQHRLEREGALMRRQLVAPEQGRQQQQQQQQQQQRPPALLRPAAPSLWPPAQAPPPAPPAGAEDDGVICLDDSGGEEEEEDAAVAAELPGGYANGAASSDDGVVLVSSGGEDEAEGQEAEQEDQEEEEEADEEDEEDEQAVAAAGSALAALDLKWTGARSDWTPTPQQLEAYDDATGGRGAPGEVVASHGRASIDLTRSLLRCMAPGEWLNDEVMNCYMALLQDRDTALREAPGSTAPRCHFFTTFFLNKLYKDSGAYEYKNVQRWTMPKRLKNTGQASDCLLKLDRLVVPVHEGMHWTAACVDLARRRFLYFDSLHGHNAACLAALKRWLADEAWDKLKERWDTSSWAEDSPRTIPRQFNGYDCGVFALLFCNRLGLGEPFDFEQRDVEVNARVAVVSELIEGRVRVPGLIGVG